MKPSIAVEDAEVILGGSRVLSVEELRLEGPGLVQVLGPNGAGKTTLLRLILGLVKPVKGRVVVNGVDVTGRPEAAGRLAGYVPQWAPHLASEAPLTPVEVVASAILLRSGYPARIRGLLSPPRWAVERALEVLRTVGLHGDALQRRVGELSGGQRQRVFIARALAWNPSIVLMDEPLSAVDPAGRVELAKLIATIAEEKLVVVTSHDPTLLLPYTKLIVLVNRRVVAAGPPSEVMKLEVLRRVYDGAVLLVPQCLHIGDAHLHPATTKP